MPYPEVQTVQIAMTTYNGERFLDQQIESILAQDYTDWQLFIRDDASSDRTPEVLRAWRDRYPEKIILIEETPPLHLGIPNTARSLMAALTSHYVMRSDQDDVWHPNKITCAMREMNRLEACHGRDVPLLVYFDARMIDQNGRQLYPSFWRHVGHRPERNRSVGRFCLECHALGCTEIFNRALVELATPTPESVRYPDWWYALVALSLGAVASSHEITLDWRRHNTNDSQTTSLWGTLVSVVRSPFRHRKVFHEKLAIARGLAIPLLSKFGERLAPRDRAAVEAFLALPELGFWGRRKEIIRHGIYFTSWFRAIGLIALI